MKSRALALPLLGILFSVQGVVCQTPADKFFLKHGFSPIPLDKQPEITPGTMIVFSGGAPRFLHPKSLPAFAPVDPAIHIPYTETKDLISTGAFAKLFGFDIKALFTKANDLTFGETDLSGGYFDDDTVEYTLLKPKTTTTTTTMYDSWHTFGPVYIVSGVYTAASLQATGAANAGFTVTVNASSPDKCTQVAAPIFVNAAGAAGAGAAGSGGAGAGGAGSGGAGAGGAGAALSSSEAKATVAKVAEAGASVVGALSSGGGQVCVGKGGRVSMNANRQVPVAMRVCEVWYAESDQTLNCRPTSRVF